jgi:transcription elongation factor Elf1
MSKTSDMWSAPNPHYKQPEYDANCPHCGKKEVVRTSKTRHPAKKMCRGCGKEYEIPLNDITWTLAHQRK